MLHSTLTSENTFYRYDNCIFFLDISDLSIVSTSVKYLHTLCAGCVVIYNHQLNVSIIIINKPMRQCILFNDSELVYYYTFLLTQQLTILVGILSLQRRQSHTFPTEDNRDHSDALRHLDVGTDAIETFLASFAVKKFQTSYLCSKF